MKPLRIWTNHMTRHRRSALYGSGIMEDYLLLIFNTHISFSRAIAVRRLTFVVLPDRQPFCVRGTRTQPLICVECSVHCWVSCAINKGRFFEIAFSSSTHFLPRFEALGYVLPHFDELTHVAIRGSSAFISPVFC